MKFHLIAGAALLVSLPAVAQVTPVQPQVIPRTPLAPKVQTRAEVQAKVAEHFTKLDTNRDGWVTKAEADTAREAMRGQMRQRFADRGMRMGGNPGQAFDRLDTDRNGMLTREEFARGAEMRQQRQAARAKGPRGMGMGMHGFGGHMFDMADADRNGRVSLQEATAAALRHFDTADVNRDGRITQDERMQVRQKMRAERQRG